MRVVIAREYYTGQTLGRLSVVSDEGKEVFSCVTLELPWLNNARRISCIPEGDYTCKRHLSPKFGQTYHVTNVANRDAILIHHGNYNRDTLGCILVGNQHKDLNKDGLLDVANSKATMSELLDIIGNKQFKLTIKSL